MPSFIYIYARVVSSIVHFLDLTVGLISSRPTSGVLRSIIVLIFLYASFVSVKVASFFSFFFWRMTNFVSLSIYCSETNLGFGFLLGLVYLLFWDNSETVCSIFYILVSTFFCKVKCILNNSDWFSSLPIRYPLSLTLQRVFQVSVIDLFWSYCF